MEEVYILLGSNRGDRRNQLKKALDMVVERVGPQFAVSGIYESPSWGFNDAVSFLNQVVGVRTSLQPEDLLDMLLSIESHLGRIRFPNGSSCGTFIGEATPPPQKYEGRSIDLDILFYGNLLIFSDRLMIPHPRLHERRFTLVPMNEIASGFIHPLLKKSIFALLSDCTDHSSVLLSD
jgi:2-amino-4-hydroxy-6-hydroxymethyldihydropteridine diphosphokinase